MGTPMCYVEGCTEHYGCRLRNKGIMLASSATPTKSANQHRTFSVPPSHYANVMYDERPGGVKMPLLKLDGTPLRHKEYHDNKTAIDQQRRSTRNDTSAQRS